VRTDVQAVDVDVEVEEPGLGALAFEPLQLAQVTASVDFRGRWREGWGTHKVKFKTEIKNGNRN
jgi:hypothetical protein